MPLVKKARLIEAEITAVALYTGPMYCLYNAVLRQSPANLFARLKEAHNYYSTTIHVLASAITKIGDAGHGLRDNMVLYRGLGGRTLPPNLSRADQDGRGLAEFAATSTTSDFHVALDYSGVKDGKPACVLKVPASQFNRPAFIGELSQYPHEEEYLWLPISYLQRGSQEDVLVATKSGLVRVVHAEIHEKNFKIEEVMSRRKTLLVSMVDTVLEEIEQALQVIQVDPGLGSRSMEEWKLLVDSIQSEVREWKDKEVQCHHAKVCEAFIVHSS